MGNAVVQSLAVTNLLKRRLSGQNVIMVVCVANVAKSALQDMAEVVFSSAVTGTTIEASRDQAVFQVHTFFFHMIAVCSPKGSRIGHGSESFVSDCRSAALRSVSTSSQDLSSLRFRFSAL